MKIDITVILSVVLRESKTLFLTLSED